MSLGKKRSRFGEFLDHNGIRQERVKEETKLNKDTITKVCNDDGYLPNGTTMKKLVDAARKLSGNKNVQQNDFWTM